MESYGYLNAIAIYTYIKFLHIVLRVSAVTRGIYFSLPTLRTKREKTESRFMTFFDETDIAANDTLIVSMGHPNSDDSKNSSCKAKVYQKLAVDGSVVTYYLHDNYNRVETSWDVVFDDLSNDVTVHVSLFASPKKHFNYSRITPQEMFSFSTGLRFRRNSDGAEWEVLCDQEVLDVLTVN